MNPLFPKIFAALVAMALAGCVSQPDSPATPSPGGGSSAAPAAGDRDGSSFDAAIVITAADEGAGVKAEYVWIRQHIPGGRPAGQFLLQNGSKSYDLIKVALADGSTRDVYFDISGFFGKH
ncbi:MAG TPA: hypothetical protein VGM73_09195 [Candidatus Didemnitutus sp.]